MRQRREKARVENPTVARALNELLVPSLPIKLVAGSDTGRPDDLFLIPHGKPLFIEFKWGDNTLEPKQEYWHGILKRLGYDVQVHNSVDNALKAIALKVVAASLHAQGGEVLARTWRSRSLFGSWIAEDLHLTRSLQFLKEAEGSEQGASDCALESGLFGMALGDS